MHLVGIVLVGGAFWVKGVPTSFTKQKHDFAQLPRFIIKVDDTHGTGDSVLPKQRVELMKCGLSSKGP
jgi:hypothetical protein